MDYNNRSYYGRYTYVGAPTRERPDATLWLCTFCEIYGDCATVDDACWASHEHELHVHERPLYPCDRNGFPYS